MIGKRDDLRRSGFFVAHAEFETEELSAWETIVKFPMDWTSELGTQGLNRVYERQERQPQVPPLRSPEFPVESGGL